MRAGADPARAPIKAPNLTRLMEDPAVLKIFHFARFDVTALKQGLGIDCRPIYCTKIASRLVRTFTDRHGLKDLCKDLLGIELSKQQQSSDWGAPELTPEQLRYAASDVLHLHALRQKLDDDAGARGAERIGPVLLRLPAHPGGARSGRLGRARHFCPLSPSRAAKLFIATRFINLCPAPIAIHLDGTWGRDT